MSYAQLVASGLTARQIGGRASNGQLVRVHRGVYRLGGAPATFEQEAMAACLAARGVASHRTAAALWDLRDCESGLVEITVAGRRRPQLDGVIGHSTLHLPSVDLTERRCVPVTTPARTLVDLADVAPFEQVEGALEDAFHRRLVTRSWLERTAFRPTPGAAVIRRLLAERDPAQRPTESTLEDEIVRLLRRAGLPEPVRQHPVPIPGRAPLRLDISYPDDLVVLEGQSLKWHAGRRDLQRDCDKRNLLVRLGWRVLVFTWDDVCRRQEFVVGTVRVALGV